MLRFSRIADQEASGRLRRSGVSVFVGYFFGLLAGFTPFFGSMPISFSMAESPLSRAVLAAAERFTFTPAARRLSASARASRRPTSSSSSLNPTWSVFTRQNVQHPVHVDQRQRACDVDFPPPLVGQPAGTLSPQLATSRRGWPDSTVNRRCRAGPSLAPRKSSHRPVQSGDATEARSSVARWPPLDAVMFRNVLTGNTPSATGRST